MLTALIIALVIGAIAGWLAGLLVQGTGFGLLGDIVVGILGALITTWLFPVLGIALGDRRRRARHNHPRLHRRGDPARHRQGDQAAHRLEAGSLAGLHQTASFAALTGRTLRIFLAGFALNTVGSLVNGLMPVRSLVAGFLTTMNLAKPGSRNSPLFFISL